jgi:hypothetical protein
MNRAFLPSNNNQRSTGVRITVASHQNWRAQMSATAVQEVGVAVRTVMCNHGYLIPLSGKEDAVWQEYFTIGNDHGFELIVIYPRQ